MRGVTVWPGVQELAKLCPELIKDVLVCVQGASLAGLDIGLCAKHGQIDGLRFMMIGA